MLILYAQFNINNFSIALIFLPTTTVPCKSLNCSSSYIFAQTYLSGIFHVAIYHKHRFTARYITGMICCKKAKTVLFFATWQEM